MAKAKAYKLFAQTLCAFRNCVASGNTEWMDKHNETMERIMDTMPRGSGFDNGTELEPERSDDTMLVFTTAFHHMDANGFYDGWTNHTVTVKASLTCEFIIHVGGRNRNDIKDHIVGVFAQALNTEWDRDVKGWHAV